MSAVITDAQMLAALPGAHVEDLAGGAWAVVLGNVSLGPGVRSDSGVVFTLGDPDLTIVTRDEDDEELIRDVTAADGVESIARTMLLAADAELVRLVRAYDATRSAISAEANPDGDPPNFDELDEADTDAAAELAQYVRGVLS